eukprot:TRINITY_DN44519_c0_g1_i1.p1 TRINITY_DN44519_c0_g1~~TRINITY_DN44519_c0_g1_i1.p1  ORF type:complete len:213 (-),score=45.97 TRINITY_DN44519_c0_g1_i1:138-776(-)
MISLFLLLSVLSHTSAFFFKLHDGMRMCFSKELSHEREIVHINAHIPALANVSPRADRGVFAEVRDPDDYVIARKELRGDHPHFSFVSNELPGEYAACLYTSGSAALSTDGKVDVWIDVTTGGERPAAQLYAQTGGTLPTVATALQEVTEQVSLVRKEMEAAKTRDARFRQTTESTSTRVWVFGIVRVLLLAALPAVMYHLLRQMFLAKKMV